MDPRALERGALPITVEVNTRPDVVQESVRELLEEGGPAALAGCDILVQIHLVGPLTDWPTVRVVWESAMGMWSAVPYAEGHGFATLDDLP
jgi:hypothetical protein